AKRARFRYSCFEHFGEDPQAYGYASSFNLDESCERAVLEQLTEIQRHTADQMRRDGVEREDEAFYAEQNARLIKNAEHYYRTMFYSNVKSWNLRDRHMSDTLNALDGYLGRRGGPAKIVVWEHNSHLGDARATDMGQRGETNVGQMA